MKYTVVLSEHFQLSRALLNMLFVTPRVSMFDAPVAISASRLKPNQKVTIRAKIDHTTGKFESCAQYIADNNGNVNLSSDPALGGSYKGSNYCIYMVVS